MNNLLTTKEYEIHYHEVGFNKKAYLTTIMNLFQDIFVYQSETNGIGFDYLLDNNLAWVVSKWDIKIYKYPIYGDKIKVKMCPVSLRNFYIYRKYQVFNENEEMIAEAISLWVLINIDKRRPCKINEELYTAFGLSLTDNKSISMEKINLAEKVHIEKVFNVGYSDIDTNGHVNNVRYVSWALDTIPKDIISEHKLTRIKINYQKETKYNEIITSGTEIIRDSNENNIRCLHKICNEDGIILTVLESIWDKEI